MHKVYKKNKVWWTISGRTIYDHIHSTQQGYLGTHGKIKWYDMDHMGDFIGAWTKLGTLSSFHHKNSNNPFFRTILDRKNCYVSMVCIFVHSLSG